MAKGLNRNLIREAERIINDYIKECSEVVIEKYPEDTEVIKRKSLSKNLIINFSLIVSISILLLVVLKFF